MLSRRKILIAVSGGIAAYKICELVRLLVKNRADLTVIMTPSATHFIAPLTFEALTGKRVETDAFIISEGSGGHLRLIQDIDLMIIAPATANRIAKLAAGMADDLVSTTSLACTAPLFLCPAMNPRMWANPAVQENLQKLRSRGILVMDPELGTMAGLNEAEGIGRLPEPAQILDRICTELPPRGPLTGKVVTVTAGPTSEAIDPVRILSNLSSGKLGYAIAAEARRRGAQVNLISGTPYLEPPPGTHPILVGSTADLLHAVESCITETSALIMAAAPCDFTPITARTEKIKKVPGKDHLTLDLVQTVDILKTLSAQKGLRHFTGFALETDSGLESARQKLKEKNLDLIALNHPADSLGTDSIQATLLSANGTKQILPVMSKAEFAVVILDQVQNDIIKLHPAPPSP